MELTGIYGEFETEELAELAALRIRRSVRGVKRIAVHPIGRSRPYRAGEARFTMLPANLRMQNYVTDVMWSEMTADPLEPLHRRTTELLVLCTPEAVRGVNAVLHSLGAVRMRESRTGKR